MNDSHFFGSNFSLEAFADVALQTRPGIGRFAVMHYIWRNMHTWVWVEWADLNFCRNELYVSCLVGVIMHIQTRCLKKLHLVKLSNLFTLNVYKIYYKLRHVSLPAYVANMFKDFSRNHEYEIRQAIILDEPNVNTSNGENCIWYLLPRIINKTNHTIVTMVDTYSYQGFVNFVQNDMIGHYIENCSISNCYICNHAHSEWLPLTYSEWVSFISKNKIK